MLYIGTGRDLALQSDRNLRVEDVDERRQEVRRWFSQPVVHFVGAHTGCSCGFPSVIAETPIEYYPGMPLEGDDRAADLQSVRALVELIGRILKDSERVELYPIADGDEAKPPKGVIRWRLRALEPEQFFFNEQFLHVVDG